MQKILFILIMIGFTVSFQTAFGSAVMPGETDTIFCDLCIDKNYQIKKSKNTEFNLNGFDFDIKDSRKYPTWVNWQPAERTNVEIKSALEQKTENDKITSHGYSRNHILFNALMELEEIKAKEKINLEKITNKDFEKLDNFYTIYFSGKNRANDIQLNENIKNQKELAGKTLENIISLRNDRY